MHGGMLQLLARALKSHAITNRSRPFAGVLTHASRSGKADCLPLFMRRSKGAVYGDRSSVSEGSRAWPSRPSKFRSLPAALFRREHLF